MTTAALAFGRWLAAAAAWFQRLPMFWQVSVIVVIFLSVAAAAHLDDMRRDPLRRLVRGRGL